MGSVLGRGLVDGVGSWVAAVTLAVVVTLVFCGSFMWKVGEVLLRTRDRLRRQWQA